jgi:hypothetical protein
MKKPRCGAKTRRGMPCQASAIFSVKSKLYTRRRNHGDVPRDLGHRRAWSVAGGQLEAWKVYALHMTERPRLFCKPQRTVTFT